MAETLNQLERRLERLEAAVIQEYSSRKLDALRDGQERLTIDEGKLDLFAGELAQMTRALYASGDPRKLQIVSEQHDIIRIRMICLQHILEREIPKPYADEALFEGGHGSHALQGRLPVTSTKAPSRSLLGRVFQRTETPQQPASRPAGPAPTNQMRLNHLHKLMEEDRRQLLRPDERPPRMPAHLPPLDPNAPPASAAEAAYRFKVKFVAEAHHGQRVHSERIARTPEELRAKLAKRAQEEGKK